MKHWSSPKHHFCTKERKKKGRKFSDWPRGAIGHCLGEDEGKREEECAIKPRRDRSLESVMQSCSNWTPKVWNWQIVYWRSWKSLNLQQRLKCFLKTCCSIWLIQEWSNGFNVLNNKTCFFGGNWNFACTRSTGTCMKKMHACFVDHASICNTERESSTSLIDGGRTGSSVRFTCLNMRRFWLDFSPCRAIFASSDGMEFHQMQKNPLFSRNCEQPECGQA